MTKPGHVVAYVGKGKTRPAIVVRLRDDGSRVAIAGSTSPPHAGKEDDAIAIKFDSRDGRRLKLTADTWFKKSFVVVLQSHTAQALWTPATCPARLLLKLEEFL